MGFETSASTFSLLDMALDPSVFTLILLLIVVISWQIVKMIGKRNYPPGPYGFPLIGNLHQIGKMPFLTFVEMSKRYGHIFSLQMGQRYTVILNSFDSVNEAFVNQSDIFNDRPQGYNIVMNDIGKNSVAYGNGPMWKEHRRMLTNALKTMGVGTTEFESKIINEVQSLVAEIRKDKLDAPMDIAKDIAKGIMNITNFIMLGKTLSYNHPVYEAIDRFQSQFLKGFRVHLHRFFPWLKHIPGFMTISGQNRISRCGLEFYRLILKEIENTEDGIQGYAQAFLGKHRSSPQDDFFTMEDLSTNVQILYLAGIETASSSIQWALVYMMAYPDVQKKVQEELDNVIGRERVPSINDRVRTPYTEATLLEILRMAPVSPLNIARSNTVTCKLGDYTLPKGSCVIANFWAIHYDPVRWGDPENFRPQRFLDEEGRLTKSNQIITFSIGKRNCLGEPLARMELYLYFTSLLKNFTIEKPYKDQPVDFTGIYDISFRPKNFKVRIKERL